MTTWNAQIAMAHQMLTDCKRENATLNTIYTSFMRHNPEQAQQAGEYLISQGYAAFNDRQYALTGTGRRKACELQGRLDGLLSGWLQPQEVYRA
jgi:hypothetical protein